MLRKALYLGLVVFVVNVVLSTLSCKRKASSDTYCRSLDNVTLTGYRQNNSQLSASDNEITATTLRLQLNVFSKTEVCMRATQGDNSVSFFNTAYAIQPASSSGYPRLDSIVGYDIISDMAYDDSHPAGASLKGVFTTDDEYILRLLNAVNTKFNFYCVKAPSENGMHTFTVSLVKNDGGVINVQSIPIKLLK